MKILIIHNEYRQKGGEESVVKTEIIALKGLGHTINTYFVKNTDINGFFKKFTSFFSAIYNFRQKRQIEKIIIANKPDIVHIHNFSPLISPAVFYACKKTNTPSVLTLHSYRILCPSSFLFHNNATYYKGINNHYICALKEKVYKDSYIATLAITLMILVHKKLKTWSKINTIITLSEFQKKIVSERVEGNFKVLQNFTHITPLEPPSNTDDYYIYVGRLSSEKGIAELVSIIPNNKKLLVVGTGPLEKQLREECVNKQNIIFKGQQNKETVLKLMSKATATIIPSIWHETFGLVIIESFSVGTPVLYNNIEPINEIIRDKELGLKFDVFDNKSLESVFKNMETQRSTFSKNCLLEFQRRYSVDVGAKKLETLFLEIIQKSSDKH